MKLILVHVQVISNTRQTSVEHEVVIMILLVFRMAFTLRSPYSILLGLPGDAYCLYLFIIPLNLDFLEINKVYNIL